MNDQKNFNLFQGSTAHCNKKPVGYMNCCRIKKDGWGDDLGANCSKDEKTLMEQRIKRLCVYVGKTTTGTSPVHVNKHHYCCFGQMLDKVIQVQGRKQLGKNFGTGERPDCRGLTLDEIQRINFNHIDFTEFIEDFKLKFAGKYKAPNTGEISSRIKGSQADLKRGDNNVSNPYNVFPDAA
jgi:conjugal transfer mating pair stabilization protein TraN